MHGQLKGFLSCATPSPSPPTPSSLASPLQAFAAPGQRVDCLVRDQLRQRQVARERGAERAGLGERGRGARLATRRGVGVGGWVMRWVRMGAREAQGNGTYACRAQGGRRTGRWASTCGLEAGARMHWPESACGCPRVWHGGGAQDLHRLAKRTRVCAGAHDYGMRCTCSGRGLCSMCASACRSACLGGEHKEKPTISQWPTSSASSSLKNASRSPVHRGLGLRLPWHGVVHAMGWAHAAPAAPPATCLTDAQVGGKLLHSVHRVLPAHSMSTTWAWEPTSRPSRPPSS